MDIKYDLALPCATKNEIDEAGAKLLVKMECWVERANLPINMQAQDVCEQFQHSRKASNAGGVGVAACKMSRTTVPELCA
jgi:glutamate dehydrogenase (NADP+)